MSKHTVDVADVVIVVIDAQERLAAAMSRRDAVVSVISRLVRVAGELSVPVVYTEQYPEGLGHTVSELRDLLLAAVGPIEKLDFDCCVEPAFITALERTGRRQVVLLGMEAHICVTQTALHLLEDGYRVQVVADGVCSVREYDHAIAIERLRIAGAEVTTSESVVYEALGTAGTDTFRRILAIVKEREIVE
ncbi:MAG: isochorismatase family protein [Coriobacteriia bacterium]|nr:isochorismatase family protein [Coriobacteriia bacterium]